MIKENEQEPKREEGGADYTYINFPTIIRDERARYYSQQIDNGAAGSWLNNATLTKAKLLERQCNDGLGWWRGFHH